MSKEIELWQFIADHLRSGKNVVLLIVAVSHGSSPGRAGYKMAVAQNGDLTGSIGGGVMEVNLVEEARALLSQPPVGGLTTALIEQEHRTNSDHPSGMICSGRQTMLRIVLTPDHLDTVAQVVAAIQGGAQVSLNLTENSLTVGQAEACTLSISFERSGNSFVYRESIGAKKNLVIVGGGHCALALSELMSKMDFSIRIFDDRPELNTLQKNDFADEITIINSYDDIADHLSDGDNTYVVVMTLGYKTDAVVIRQLLLGKQFKYFGVLGSKAKMATLLKELRAEGYPQEHLDALRTPVGLPINSHTPEEIAVSIAAEIIFVKNTG